MDTRVRVDRLLNNMATDLCDSMPWPALPELPCLVILLISIARCTNVLISWGDRSAVLRKWRGAKGLTAGEDDVALRAE